MEDAAVAHDGDGAALVVRLELRFGARIGKGETAAGLNGAAMV